MTGYAVHEQSTQNGTLQVELRSVNQRYLELLPKLDDSCRTLEPQVRETLKSALRRGKVECRVNLVRSQPDALAAHLNTEAVEQVAESVKAIAAYFPEAQAVNVLDVLRMPGVVSSVGINQDALTTDLQDTLDIAVKELVAARAREGDKLKAMILARLSEVEMLVSQVKPMLPEMVKTYQAKLLAKLEEAQLTQDDERIRQEITLYTQRIDVDEELSRLTAHIDEVKRILSEGGVAGKKLDFLMQEMNREANTLGSKSVAIQTTQTSMQLKVLIEQMREQIQNIE